MLGAISRQATDVSDGFAEGQLPLKSFWGEKLRRRNE